MKSIGKIIDFNGYNGSLIDNDKQEHIFTSDDLISKEIKKNDIVSFDSELFKTVDIELYIARFIKKIEKN